MTPAGTGLEAAVRDTEAARSGARAGEEGEQGVGLIGASVSAATGLEDSSSDSK